MAGRRVREATTAVVTTRIIPSAEIDTVRHDEYPDQRDGVQSCHPILHKKLELISIAEDHIALPSTIPAAAAASPSTTLAPRLTAALEISPFSNCWIVATLNVEKVV